MNKQSVKLILIDKQERAKKIYESLTSFIIKLIPTFLWVAYEAQTPRRHTIIKCSPYPVLKRHLTGVRLKNTKNHTNATLTTTYGHSTGTYEKYTPCYTSSHSYHALYNWLYNVFEHDSTSDRLIQLCYWNYKIWLHATEKVLLTVPSPNGSLGTLKSSRPEERPASSSKSTFDQASWV